MGKNKMPLPPPISQEKEYYDWVCMVLSNGLVKKDMKISFLKYKKYFELKGGYAIPFSYLIDDINPAK